MQNDKTFDAPKAHRYFVLTYLKENKLDKSKTELLKLLDTIIFIKVNVQKVLYEFDQILVFFWYDFCYLNNVISYIRREDLFSIFFKFV